MKVPDFIKWAESMQKEENRLMLVKGKEYTVSDEDKFKNFKSIAERMESKSRTSMPYLFIKTYGFHPQLRSHRQ